MKACRMRVLFEIEKMRERLAVPAGRETARPCATARAAMAAVSPQTGLFCLSGISFSVVLHNAPLSQNRGAFFIRNVRPFTLCPKFGGYFAAVQNNVFPGQGSALIETNHRAELVLPPDAHLPVTLHRHSVKEACVLAIQRGILATTAECLFIFHCAERNEDKAGASSAPFSFPILQESYMATQKLLSEAFSLQEEL